LSVCFSLSLRRFFKVADGSGSDWGASGSKSPKTKLGGGAGTAVGMSMRKSGEVVFSAMLKPIDNAVLGETI